MAGSGSMVPKGAESITGEGHNADDESEEAMLQKAIALSQAGEAKTNDEDVGVDGGLMLFGKKGGVTTGASRSPIFEWKRSGLG